MARGPGRRFADSQPLQWPCPNNCVFCCVQTDVFPSLKGQLPSDLQSHSALFPSPTTTCALSLLIILVLLSGLGNALSVQTLFSIFSTQLSDNPWLLLFLHCLEPFCNIPRQMQIPGHRTDYVAGVCSPPHREISAHRDRHWSVSKRVVNPVSEAASTANHTRQERLQQVNSSPTRLARPRRGGTISPTPPFCKIIPS